MAKVRGTCGECGRSRTPAHVIVDLTRGGGAFSDVDWNATDNCGVLVRWPHPISVTRDVFLCLACLKRLDPVALLGGLHA
jgi:hypothetical protein